MKMIRAASDLRIDILMLLTLLSGVLIQSVLFLFDVKCSGIPMWLTFLCTTAILAMTSVRRCIFFLALTFVLLILTTFTFSYTGTDVMNYHFPMQDLIRCGWNPVYVAKAEDFKAVLGGRTLSLVHTLFLPRMTALCGALVGASTGLFVADSFLSYALVASLCASSYVFAKRVMGAERNVAMLFSFAIVCTTKFTAFLSGYVDYVSYASLMLTLFGGCMYALEKRNEDLVLMILGMAIASLAKTTGLVVSVMFAVALLPFPWRDKRFYAAGGIVLGLVLVVGCSPLVTSWVHYGCPLYPTMSLSVEHPVIDITSDFTGNEDAMRMGYVARSCYAWVSPSITTKVCALIYGQPHFHPVFDVCGGVAGFGTAFRFLLGLSVLALLFSKKNSVTLLCVFVFLTTLVTPLKYVGFPRYFLQVWAIPPLAIFNFVTAPVLHGRNEWLGRTLKIAALTIPVSIAALCFLRSLAFYGRSIAIEDARQKTLENMKQDSDTWCLSSKWQNTYSLTRRLDAAGIKWKRKEDADKTCPMMSYDGKYLWATAVKDARQEAEIYEQRFPIADSVGMLVRFPWRRAFSSFPRPLLFAVREVSK